MPSMTAIPARSASTRSHLRRRLRRAVLGHRRLLAAFLAAVAVLGMLQALRVDPVAPVEPKTTMATSSLGERLSAEHPGLTPIPVRLPDAEMAALLQPGDRITLLATENVAGESGARVVATGVEILQTMPGTAQNRVTGGEVGRLIIVGVPAASTRPVAAAAVRSVLTYAWDR